MPVFPPKPLMFSGTSGCFPRKMPSMNPVGWFFNNKMQWENHGRPESLPLSTQTCSPTSISSHATPIRSCIYSENKTGLMLVQITKKRDDSGWKTRMQQWLKRLLSSIQNTWCHKCFRPLHKMRRECSMFKVKVQNKLGKRKKNNKPYDHINWKADIFIKQP